MKLWPIILGVTAVVIVLLVGYFVTKWGVFDNESEDEGADSISREEERQQELDRIPLRDKHRQLTLPMKVLLFALALASLITTYYIYRFLKTGSPVTFQYVRELQFMAVAVAGVGGGVWFRSWARGRVGRLEIDFEGTDGTAVDETNTVYFLYREATARDDGTIKVRALFPTLIASLFPRKRLAGHDPRLRGDRPLGKRVTYEVPLHARELDDGYYVRTQGEQIVNGAAPTDVDVRFSPPYELPYKAYVAQREQLQKKETRMDSLRAQKAEAEAQLRDLKRLIENTEYREQDQVLDQIERVRDIVMPNQNQIHLQQGRGAQRNGHQMPQTQAEHHRQAQERRNDRNGGGGGA